MLGPTAIAFAIASLPWGPVHGRPLVPGGWLGVAFDALAGVWFGVVGLRYLSGVVQPETLDLDRDGLVRQSLFAGETRVAWKSSGRFVVALKTWPGDGIETGDLAARRQLVTCSTGTVEPPRGLRARVNRALHPRQVPIVAPFRPGQGPWSLDGPDLVLLFDRYRQAYGSSW